MTDDLVAFLRAREDEREASARHLLRRVQDVQLKLEDPKYLGLEMPGWHTWPEVEAMATSVIADVEAKRRILDKIDWHRDLARRTGNPWHGDSFAGYTLRATALPYAGHEDYNLDWSIR